MLSLQPCDSEKATQLIVLKIYLFLFYGCDCWPACVYDAYTRQKTASYPPKLELQMAVSLSGGAWF